MILYWRKHSKKKATSVYGSVLLFRLLTNCEYISRRAALNCDEFLKIKRRTILQFPMKTSGKAGITHRYTVPILFLLTFLLHASICFIRHLYGVPDNFASVYFSVHWVNGPLMLTNIEGLLKLVKVIISFTAVFSQLSLQPRFRK